MLKTSKGSKVYGAAIVSSPKETKHCVDPRTVVLDFDVKKIMATDDIVDGKVQAVYFGSTSVDSAIEDCQRHFAETY